jgi:hypothetical protein
MNKFKINEPIPGVIHLLFEDRFRMGLSMCRMSEFFESPYDAIRGRQFTFMEFIEAYWKADGTGDYWSYFEGYNIPKKVVDQFFKAHEYSGTLTIYENKIKQVWEDFEGEYLIATDGLEDVLEHELAHARYALDPAYKQVVRDFIEGLDLNVRHRLIKGLLQDDRYVNDKEMLLDETHAYLLTSFDEELLEMFPEVELNLLRSLQQQLKSLTKSFTFTEKGV